MGRKVVLLSIIHVKKSSSSDNDSFSKIIEKELLTEGTAFSLRTGRNILAQTKAPKQEGGNTKWQA